MDNENVVVFYNWFGGINGALIDAFEYFLAILQHERIFLLMLNCSKTQLDKFIEVFENRYYLDDIKWKGNIGRVPKVSKLINYKFKKALVVDYSTIQKTKGILRADKIVVISDLHTDNPDYMYDKKLQNVWYYGEMPFVYKDQRYKSKMLFDWMKKPKNVKEGIYVNIPGLKDHSIFETLMTNQAPFKFKPIIFKSEIHLNNMFGQFDEYYYIHANKWFHPHPRLFHECAYMDKKIKYYNPCGVKDGSYYRVIDLFDNNDLNERYLDENDEVIQEFI